MWSSLLKHAAGVPDGWDDDGDVDDEEEDANELETNNRDNTNNNSNSGNGNDSEPESKDSRTDGVSQKTGGGRMLMGRLTAFIEQVTQADSTEAFQGDADLEDDEENESEPGDDDKNNTAVDQLYAATSPYRGDSSPNNRSVDGPRLAFMTPMQRHEDVTNDAWQDEDEFDFSEANQSTPAAAGGGDTSQQPDAASADPNWYMSQEQLGDAASTDQSAWEQDELDLSAVQFSTNDNDQPVAQGNYNFAAEQQEQQQRAGDGDGVLDAVNLAAAFVDQTSSDVRPTVNDSFASALIDGVAAIPDPFHNPEKASVEGEEDDDDIIELAVNMAAAVSRQRILDDTPADVSSPEDDVARSAATDDAAVNGDGDRGDHDVAISAARDAVHEPSQAEAEDAVADASNHSESLALPCDQEEVDHYERAVAEIQEDMLRLSYDADEEEILFEQQYGDEELNPDEADRWVERKSPVASSESETVALAELEADMQNLSLKSEVLESPRDHEQLVVVDHTPLAHANDNLLAGPPSMSVLPDASSSSSSCNGDTLQNPFDTAVESDFGPVVDHTPRVSGFHMNRQVSGESFLAVAAGGFSTEDTIDEGWEEEDVDDQLEETEHSIESTFNDAPKDPPSDQVVDHTPAEISGTSKQARKDISIGVLLPDDASTRADEGDEADDYGPVVDHTPLQSNITEPVVDPSILTGAESMAVYAPTLDDDCGLDETEYDGSSAGTNAWDGDDDDFAGVCGSPGLDEDPQSSGAASSNHHEPAPIAANSVKFRVEGLEEVHIVDHTPRDMDDLVEAVNQDPSLLVLATVQDVSGAAGDDDAYDDDNDFAYGPVVDLTPATPGSTAVSSAFSTTNSMAVVGVDLESEYNEDDAMDDTAFGDSTVGGVTFDGGTEGWEQVDNIIDTIMEGVEEHVVDHTPSEMGSLTPRMTDSSIAVLGDVTSMKDDDTVADQGSTGDDIVGFGPVVDQTPPTPIFSNFGFREDSIAAQAQDLDTIDETFNFDSHEDENVREAVVSEVEPSIFRLPQDLLVDHIPIRSESRFGDASTLVAADPSEVMSEGDDMVGIEDNFGPVVDLIPSTRPRVLANLRSMAESAAGSTAVFAPASVAADDLDADDNETRNEDVEEFPNPQSGGDEPADELHMDEDEQLVDILPEDPDEPDLAQEEEAREALSVATVGGALSVLLPLALDVKDDEFGPVVDQLPSPHDGVATRSGHSIATQLTPSECQALAREDVSSERQDDGRRVVKSSIVVDHLPRRLGRSDSSIGASQLPEDDDDDDDDDEDNISKFGPIVDQLPMSTVPSYGGSTVDALANLSEAPSDDDEADAWDDDIDVDISEGGVSDGTALRTAMATRMLLLKSGDGGRNATVRFDTSVGPDQLSHETPHSAEASRPGDFVVASEALAEITGTDLEWTDTGAATSRVLHLEESPDFAVPFPKSFAEADTPPSTPYRRFNESEGDSPGSFTAFRCATCENGQSVVCPCIQKLLNVNHKKGSLIGTVFTPEGAQVELDFSELLETEMMKRRFVENESSGLRSALESRQFSDSIRAVKQAELESEITSLQQCNAALQARLDSLEASAESERNSLTDALAGSRQTLQTQDNLSPDDALKSPLAYEDLLSTVETLRAELAAKSSECTDLSTAVSHSKAVGDQLLAQHQTKLEAMSMMYEGKLDELRRIVQSSEEAVTLLQHSSTDSIETLSAEVEQLRKSKESLSQTISDLLLQAEDERREHDSVRHEALVAAKDADEVNGSLAVELAQQRAMAEQCTAMAAELLAVAKERDLLQDAQVESNEAITALRSRIDEHGLERESLDGRRESEITVLKTKIKELQAHLSAVETEATNERLAFQSDLDILRRELRECESVRDLLKSSAEATLKQLAMADETNAKLNRDIGMLQTDLSTSQSEVHRLDEERIKALAHLAALGRRLERKEKEFLVNAEKLCGVETQLESARESLATSASERQSIAEESERLLVRLNSLEHQSSQLLAESQRKMNALAADHQELIERSSEQIESLSGQLQECADLLNVVERERSELSSRCQIAEETVTSTTIASQSQIALLSEQYEVKLLQQASLIQERAAECESLQNRCTQLSEEASGYVHALRQQTGCGNLREHELTIMVTEQQLHVRTITDERDASMQLNRDLQQDLDRLNDERQSLVAENEEMLVQFGILKHEMDALELQVATLQKDLSVATASSTVGSASKDDGAALTAAADDETRVLQSPQDSPRPQEVEVYKALVAERDACITRLEAELREAIQYLHNTRATERATASAAYEGLNPAVDELEQLNGVQETMTDKETEPKSKSEEVRALHDRIRQLEGQLRERGTHHSMQTKLIKIEQANPSPTAASPDDVQDAVTQHTMTAREQLSRKVADLQLEPFDCPRTEDVDGIDDIRSLRSHIVSLAIALERSETKRAESIARLIADREANAESLRRLSDSVKKFYSSVSLGDE